MPRRIVPKAEPFMVFHRLACGELSVAAYEAALLTLLLASLVRSLVHLVLRAEDLQVTL